MEIAMKKFGLLQNLMVVFLILGTTATVSRAQTITTLTNFNGTNGAYPLGTLVEGSDGNFYGTTSSGGTNGVFSDGTIFKVTPGGTLTTLHEFNGNDGDQPSVALVHATDGDFYGTTFKVGPATTARSSRLVRRARSRCCTASREAPTNATPDR
jgi:uncharacterized repeat protein (TIGR03803 family)